RNDVGTAKNGGNDGKGAPKGKDRGPIKREAVRRSCLVGSPLQRRQNRSRSDIMRALEMSRRDIEPPSIQDPAHFRHQVDGPLEIRTSPCHAICSRVLSGISRGLISCARSAHPISTAFLPPRLARYMIWSTAFISDAAFCPLSG
ncbi:hypothetical protein OY671_012989, partial [Metschnikowia pulcherrima]